MRLAQISCLVVAGLLAAPAHAAIDGKVAGLNEATFAALSTVKQRNPGSLTERDAQEIGAVIMADQVVDDAERDLLEEMTQSMFRSITVTPAGDTARSVRTYPTSGNAKRLLQGVLNPVSYTHLDVYKRQEHTQVLANDFVAKLQTATRVAAAEATSGWLSIADAYDKFQAVSRASLIEFKKELVEAALDGQVELSPLNVASSLPSQLRERSATEFGGRTYHFLRITKRQSVA